MRIKNWDTFLFILIYHLLLLALLPFFIKVASWPAAIFFAVTFCIGGLSITAGYHRLFSHRSYAAHPVYEWIVLLSSTLGFQWSALIWSHDHRLHHKHVDSDNDPYSVKTGFWHAHVLWLFTYKRDYNPGVVSDLLKNPRVMFQHQYYIPLAIGVNLAVFGVGCLFMHPLASFYAGCLLRMFAIHHCTWFINSLAHFWGSKTYARELTAVDNAILALLTFGEGYHNYHHVFAADYRNGIRWYHFDPTKWVVWTASKLGITRNLRTAEQVRIQKRLVEQDHEMLMERLRHEMDEMAVELREGLRSVAEAFEVKSTALLAKLNQWKAASKDQRQALRAEIRHLNRDLQQCWREWLSLTRVAANNYTLSH